MKPIVKIVLIVVGVALLGFLAYFIWTHFFVPAPQTVPAASSDNAPGAAINLGGTRGGATTTGTTGTFEPAPPGGGGAGSSGTTGGAGLGGGATVPSGGAQPAGTPRAPRTYSFDPQPPDPNRRPLVQGAFTLKKLSDRPILSFWVSKSANVAYYLTVDGAVIQASSDKNVEISRQRVTSPLAAEASPSGDQALVSYGTASAPQWAIFDTIGKIWHPLPKELIRVTWGGADNKLVGTLTRNGVPVLATINLAKQPYAFAVLVNNFAMQNVLFSARSQNEVIIAEAPSASYGGRVWQVDTKAASTTLVMNTAFGLTLRWGNDRDVLFRFASPNQFSILSRSFSNLFSPSFVTLPEKCDGGTSVAYCFVPSDVAFASAALPDDYWMRKLFTTDDLVRVDVSGTAVATVLSSGVAQTPAIDATDVRVVNSYVYFRNRYDDALYVAIPPESVTPSSQAGSDGY